MINACSFLRILREERGSAIPMIGMGIMLIITAAGTAIDMARAQIVQSRMSSALDNAGLAAGAVLNSSDITAQTSKYFYANFPASYLGTTITSLTATPNADNTIITLNVTGTVPMTFMKLLAIDNVQVSARSEITLSNKGIELVLVMDNTGSMSANGKLTAMKSAATDLVNILYGTKTSIPNLWIGLVPFSQAVNIGSSRTSWVSSDSFNWGPGSWNGCVDARETGGMDSTDTPPNASTPTTLFPRYYWVCDSNNKWYGDNPSSYNDCSLNANTRYKTLSTSLGPNKNCPQTVTPLTKSKTTILNGINAMTAQGNTHINIGAAWGWRMLSPRWRGLWGGEMNTDQLPLDYNTPLMNKVMIILTDGENTIDNTTRTAYWYLSDSKLGTTNSTSAVNQLNTRLTSICTAAKAQGIIIYTIGLGNPGATADTLLQNCASNPDYYFDTPTNAELQTAFHMIGDSLANLRISK